MLINNGPKIDHWGTPNCKCSRVDLVSWNPTIFPVEDAVVWWLASAVMQSESHCIVLFPYERTSIALSVCSLFYPKTGQIRYFVVIYTNKSLSVWFHFSDRFMATRAGNKTGTCLVRRRYKAIMGRGLCWIGQMPQPRRNETSWSRATTSFERHNCFGENNLR